MVHALHSPVTAACWSIEMCLPDMHYTDHYCSIDKLIWQVASGH
jgi:hypothetical protein